MSEAVRTEPRPIPSDATLVWLASERAAPLFRTLDRTKAFGPLVVLLAMLPSVLATFGESVTAEDAAWGLRALDVTGSESPPALAAAMEAAVPADAVRPLPLWVSAGAMRLAGPAVPAAGSLASLAGGAMLLGVLWPLAKSLTGRRLAFWAVLLAAFHPTLTGLLRFPSPVTLGLAASVAAVWGSLNLEGKPLRLLLTGLGTVAAVAAALTLQGPIALVVPAVIAADAVVSLATAGLNGPVRQAGRGALTAAELLPRRVGAAAAGVAIWAGLRAAGAAGPAGLGDAAVVDGELSPEAMASAGFGPLWGLAAVGVGRLLRVAHRRASARSPRPVPRLVLVWLAGGIAGVAFRGGLEVSGFDPTGRYAVAFVTLPLLLAAAYAIEEAARRTVSGAWVLLAVALPLAVRLGTVMASAPSDSPAAWVAVAAGVAGLLWLAARILPTATPMPGLRRGFLMGAILLAVVAEATDGAGLLLEDAASGDAYRVLTERLRAAGPADVAALVAESPPLELAFGLRASYPDARMIVAPSWDAASAALRAGPADAAGETVVAAWGLREGGTDFSETLGLVGEAMLFDGRELLVYSTRRGPAVAP